MPRTLSQAVAFILGFWIALWLSPLRGDASAADRNELAPHAALEATFHDQVNAVRSGRHLIPLRRLPELDRVARAHSEDMARRAYLSHVNPEGLNPVHRLEAAGIEGFSLAAENAGQTDRPEPNREILHGWLASPDHRTNLHAPPFNATGIGIARGPGGTFYYTQLYLTYPR